MRRALIAVFALLALTLLYAGYAFLSLRQLEAGVKAGDAAAISDHVDFPAVRASIKEQLSAIVMSRALDEADKHRSAGARLGAGLLAAIGPALIDTAVDRFVSPAAIGALLARRAPAAGGGGSEAGGQEPKELDLRRFAHRFELLSPTRFRITHKDGVAIVFVLADWTWKVADIRIPPDILKKILRPDAGERL
ncbi:DUF2939 family protein [Methylosinus sp. sav-2]|uniref:DUF2939 domain-containing protein n=1 Tax=Methylosinus sp. sav-2 TaxID=2485168 RepID=UPI00068FAFF2|nr:DUF2939 domain-containing protein [Methylosinus sp. sav-2]TDX67481.1 DUF2939 family protein [Methylosinus sp. sav-2]